MADNRIDIPKHAKDFRHTGLSFSVSSRNLTPDIDIVHYLKILYIYCDFNQIESVFGNTSAFSRLYGGRQFHPRYALTRHHIDRLADHGIGLAMTLTNHFFYEDAYKETVNLLKVHHKKGNSIICTNDKLALRIKNDFPDYEVKASIIKNINTIEKVKKALSVYDSLTLPMDKNDDDEFLSRIEEKQRIILFGNAECAYTCPSRTCYLGFSQEMMGLPVTSSCSRSTLPRPEKGPVYFNIKKISAMGFKRFKLIPVSRHWPEQTARTFSNRKKYFINTMKKRKGLFHVCSYPKCGRTWLRFILANYLNERFCLKMNVTLHSMFSILPNEKSGNGTGPESYAYADDNRFPLIVFSHETYRQNMFENNNIVFLIRSIPDVVVSEYFQVSRFLGLDNGSLMECVYDPQGGLKRYCRYLNAWASYLGKHKSEIVSYEALQGDASKVVGNVLNFMDIYVDKDMVDRAVRLSSFNRMAKIEKEYGIPLAVGDYKDPEARRLRIGKIGSFAEYVDRDTMKYMVEESNTLLSPVAKGMLKRFGISPGQVIQPFLDRICSYGEML